VKPVTSRIGAGAVSPSSRGRGLLSITAAALFGATASAPVISLPARGGSGSPTGLATASSTAPSRACQDPKLMKKVRAFFGAFNAGDVYLQRRVPPRSSGIRS
jgi:hypothetical protein